MKVIGIELCMELLYSIVVYEYFKTFFQRKNIKGIYFYIWVISSVLQITEKYIIGDIPNYVHLITGVLSLLCLSLFYEGEMLAKIVFTLLHVIIGMLCELIIGNLFLILGVSLKKFELVGFLATNMLMLSIIMALQRFFNNGRIGKLPLQTSLKIMVLPIGSMFLAHTLFENDCDLENRGFSYDTVICIILIFIINIVAFNIYIQLGEKIELKYKNSIYEKEFKLYKQNMEEKELIMDDFRRMRHDLKNQMISLLQLLEQKKYNKLEHELVELTELKVLQGKLGSITDNSIVNTIVNYKKEMARNEGIAFNCNINVPIELPFNSEDLCVILGNVLDNAIEANKRGNVKKTFISLDIVFDGMNLIVVVENSFDGKLLLNKSGNVFTRKRNVKNHGIGLYSVQKILKTYNGEYDTIVKDNVYRVEIILHKSSGE